MKLTHEQMGKLIAKAAHEPRRNAKRYLKDLGGTGSADELDRELATAKANPLAMAIAARLDQQRAIVAKTVDAGVDGRVAETLAEIRLHMQDRGMTQSELAGLCGWPQSLVAAYLTGAKSPGLDNLVKIATALESTWRLVPGTSGTTVDREA